MPVDSRPNGRSRRSSLPVVDEVYFQVDTAEDEIEHHDREGPGDRTEESATTFGWKAGDEVEFVREKDGVKILPVKKRRKGHDVVERLRQVGVEL